MTAHGQFQTAAQSQPIDRRHDRLGRVLDQFDDVFEFRHVGGTREIEFADIGAGDEHPPGPGQHHGMAVGISHAGADGLLQSLDHGETQRIGRWVVDGDDADGALLGKFNHVAHGLKLNLSVRWRAFG